MADFTIPLATVVMPNVLGTNSTTAGVGYCANQELLTMLIQYINTALQLLVQSLEQTTGITITLPGVPQFTLQTPAVSLSGTPEYRRDLISRTPDLRRGYTGNVVPTGQGAGAIPYRFTFPGFDPLRVDGRQITVPGQDPFDLTMQLTVQNIQSIVQALESVGQTVDIPIDALLIPGNCSNVGQQIQTIQQLNDIINTLGPGGGPLPPLPPPLGCPFVWHSLPLTCTSGLDKWDIHASTDGSFAAPSTCTSVIAGTMGTTLRANLSTGVTPTNANQVEFEERFLTRHPLGTCIADATHHVELHFKGNAAVTINSHDGALPPNSVVDIFYTFFPSGTVAQGILDLGRGSSAATPFDVIILHFGPLGDIEFAISDIRVRMISGTLISPNPAHFNGYVVLDSLNVEIFQV